MSDFITRPNPTEVGDRFPSLTALREAHSALLKRHREQGNRLEVLTDIEQFLVNGAATGALLDNDEDRWAAQSLLDYWNSLLYRVYRTGKEPPDATLIEFDPNLAPYLEDKLCPYLGLEAFRETHQELFFGRQRLVEELKKHLETHRLLIVVGSSGSGKSSVVLGGLLPRLKAGDLPKSQNWHYYPSVVPGSDPLIALARCVKPSASLKQQALELQQNPNQLISLVEQSDRQPSVLVIDQFEEVFTLCQDVKVREAFVQALLSLIRMPGVEHKLILTIRKDYAKRLAELPDLMELFEESSILITDLDAHELRETIEMPAAKVGLKFEAGLVDTLIRDVLGETAALPLLQFTLLKLWDHRARNCVTWEAYRRLGGGRLALAKSADEFYEDLSSKEQRTAERILLRMVQLTDGLEITSKRILRKELYVLGEASDRVERVLDKLIRARLVRITEGDTPDDTQVEVAHEALIRNWPKLVGWLDTERSSSRQRLRLTGAAEQWRDKKRDVNLLWRGSLLEEAQGYQGLDSLESEFLTTSKATEKCRQQKEYKQIQFQKRAIVGLVSLAIISIVLLCVVIHQLQQDHRQRVELLAAHAEALADNQPVQAVIHAIAAKGLSQSLFTRFPDLPQFVSVDRSLLVVTSINRERNQMSSTAAVLSVAFSADGQRIVSGSADKTVQVWDAATGTPIGPPLPGHTAAVLSVAFSADGQRIVSGSEDKTVRVWDAATNTPINTSLPGHTAAVLSVAFSADGQRIVSGSEDKTVRVWDAATGTPINTSLPEHTDAVLSVAFSADGQRIVSGSADGTVRVWDATPGTSIGPPLPGHTAAVLSVAFSANGQRIVSGSADKTVRVWDAATGTPIGPPLPGHTAAVLSVAFSADGQRIVSGSADKTVRVWDAATGTPIGPPLPGHTAAVLSVAFSADGQRIVSGSEDKTVRVWDATPGTSINTSLPGHTAAVLSVAFSANGQRIVSGSEDGTVRVWDAATNTPINTSLPGHTDAVLSVAFSANGQRIVSGNADGTVRVWDATPGTSIGPPLPGHTAAVLSVAFSADGQRIVSGSADKTVRVWDAATGTPIGSPLPGHTDAVLSVAFSADGQRIVSGSADKTVRVWDAATGTPIGSPLPGHTAAVLSVAFSADGQRIVSGSADGTVRAWDAATGTPIGSPLPGHTAAVRSVAFSADGQRIVSGSADKTVQVWDAATGTPIGPPLPGHTDAVLSVAFSADGQRIVSGSADKTVRVWKISWEEACNQLRHHPSLNEKMGVAPEAKQTCERYVYNR